MLKIEELINRNAKGGFEENRKCIAKRDEMKWM